MRHSAWTLWLVPLALPLVLFCIPGSREPLDSRVRDDRGAVEAVSARETVRPQQTPAVVLPPAPSADDLSAEAEARYFR
jgi:hypothetical protein